MRYGIGLSVVGAVALWTGCKKAQAPLPQDAASVQARLQVTLADLAVFGDKHAGTDAGMSAGDYVFARMSAAGVQKVRFEPFTFPAFTVSSSSLAVTAQGSAIPMSAEVFAYSGAGHVDADIVYAGTGHETNYTGLNTTGKIVLVDRDPRFHRSIQYKLIVAHGGVAMLYSSQAPSNLIQVGTISEPQDGLGTIPAMTIGQNDGTALEQALGGGQTVHAVMDVSANIAPATGRNVVGVLPGSEPTGAYLVVGAHYDTWFTGSADNSTGVATMLELADTLARQPKRKFSLVFVGYDGEELGLFGGYDYLRRHVVVNQDPMLAFLNFEIPGAGSDGARAIGHTNGSPLDGAMRQSSTTQLYPVYVGMEAVPALFGGVIPTDIQGMYWGGLQGFSTACDTSYYHTTADTPDRIDTAFLAQAVANFEQTLNVLDGRQVTDFEVHDPQVWTIQATPSTTASGLATHVQVMDGSGKPAGAISATLWLDVDDFTRAFTQTVQTAPDGTADFLVPTAALTAGAGHRWVHVTAGETYPLAERILPGP